MIQTRQCETRNGSVLKVEEPVLLTYRYPCHRVLFNAARDANPFFHLYEALWMLAGREDVAPLAYYNKRMSEFSDDGVTLHGAYGYRWREADTCAMVRDQLEILIEHLKDNPTSRRAVLQMWEIENDLLDLTSKDLPCNTHAYFAIHGSHHKQLDMTVCNRSNDMIWGMLGANAVHFSFLQEYMANSLGVEVGHYHQFTNNLHVYTNNWKPVEWLAEYGQGTTQSDKWYDGEVKLLSGKNGLSCSDDDQIAKFVEINKGPDLVSPYQRWNSPFLDLVAQKAIQAFHAHKHRDYKAAMGWCSEIVADDWRIACTDWISRRANRYAGK